jgi:hypothetical protein
MVQPLQSERRDIVGRVVYQRDHRRDHLQRERYWSRHRLNNLVVPDGQVNFRLPRGHFVCGLANWMELDQMDEEAELAEV